MRTKIIILGLLAILAVGLYLKVDLSIFYNNAIRDASNKITDFKRTSVDALREIEDRVFAPAPLRSTSDSPKASLTAHGVVEWTNIQRSENGGLLPLSRNALLDAAASAKVRDMFEKQYFEHVSPDSKGPSDLATMAGYEYLIIGENLALGNFENDKVLVQAWMDSPGHRANILNDSYTEIGVAVMEGLYEGRVTWLAVQEFGRPLSDCPEPNMDLKASIESINSQIDTLVILIREKKTEIESIRPKKGREYESKVNEYNEMIGIYNQLINEVGALIDSYNAEVNSFNECIG